MRNERYGITRDSSDIKIIIILWPTLWQKNLTTCTKWTYSLQGTNFQSLHKKKN